MLTKYSNYLKNISFIQLDWLKDLDTFLYNSNSPRVICLFEIENNVFILVFCNKCTVNIDINKKILIINNELINFNFIYEIFEDIYHYLDNYICSYSTDFDDYYDILSNLMNEKYIVSNTLLCSILGNPCKKNIYEKRDQIIQSVV